MFDYTAIVNRIKTASWSSYSHPTDVFKRFTGPTYPLSAIAVQSKEYTFNKL